MKKLIVAIMALTVIFTVAACGKKDETASAPSSAPVSTPASASSSGSTGAKELKITASNWKFDQAEYKVKAGETYKVTLNSSEGAHGFKANGIDLTVGTNKTVEYKFDKPGTYEIQCNIPCGNDHLKMKAKIVVEA